MRRSTDFLAGLVLGLILMGATIGVSAHGSDASQHMHQAMQQMMATMQKSPMTGNVDHDFASMMIPHHQGAIDMAKLELQYGKDPQLKRMARKMVSEQQKEVADLRAWLARHPAPAASPSPTHHH